MKFGCLICLCISLLWGSGGFSEIVYKHSMDGNPDTLDPISFNDRYSNKVVIAIYESLYHYKYLKSPLELKPLLAEAMPKISSDSLTFTIPIRKNIYFADDSCFPNGKGREILAHDFVYSIQRHFDPQNRSLGRFLWDGKILGMKEWVKNGADYSKPIEGLKALNPYTLQIKLTKPFPSFLHTLAMGYSVVVPKEAVDYYGKALAHHPVGTGPFKLESMNTNKVVLVKNPKFRKEIFDPQAEGYDAQMHSFTGIAQLKNKPLPFVDKVEIYLTKQDSASWFSFSKGNEIQFTNLPSLYFHKLVQNKEPLQLHKPYSDRYHVRKEEEMGFHYLGFNMGNKEIGQDPDPERNQRNRALRCAIRKAFDWKQFIKRAYFDLGQAFPGVAPHYVEGHEPGLSKSSVQQDLEGARSLLSKNGWNASTLPTLRYANVGTVSNKQYFDMFKDWMIKIGYPPKKVIFDIYPNFGKYVEALYSNKLMLFYHAWHFDFPDAQNGMQLYYGPYSTPGSNFANYKNETFDKLFEKSVLLENQQERSKLFRRMNEILIEDCALVSGYTRTRILMWHKNLIFFPSEFSNMDVFRYVAYR